MPLLPGVGYVGQRLATSIARACGGDYWVQSQCRKAAAGLTVWVDPIGTGVGVAHEMYNLFQEADKNEREARSGDECQADQT
jgi:hypothetical protein